MTTFPLLVGSTSYRCPICGKRRPAYILQTAPGMNYRVELREPPDCPHSLSADDAAEVMTLVLQKYLTEGMETPSA